MTFFQSRFFTKEEDESGFLFQPENNSFDLLSTRRSEDDFFFLGSDREDDSNILQGHESPQPRFIEKHVFQNIDQGQNNSPGMTLTLQQSSAAPATNDTWNNFEARSIDGSGNNLTHLNYGQSHTAFATISGYEYGDGFSSPNDQNRPNVRDISNALFAQVGEMYSSAHMSNFLWIWGQFLDHDINLTAEGNEAYNIVVPTGDIYFDPYGTGAQVIEFTRSDYEDGSGTDVDNPRLQVNKITAFIDASNVYGSTAEQEALLRGDGGKLKLSAGDLLPTQMGDHGPEFLAGDERANENIALTSMHTIFAREHNHWVDVLKAQHPTYSDEELYQKAKAIVEAEIQHITYDEFLPALLGKDALATYQGYNPNIDPRITTEFATAAFRVGHTMLSSNIYRLMENGDESVNGHLTLQQAFFRPDIVMRGGIDDILRGAGSSYSQNIDYSIIDDVRNFLFGPPGAGGFDLVSLNIQRGRDHGLPDFNTVREAYGLDTVDDFEALTGDADLATKLESLYGDISNLDLWVGGLLETAYEDALVGETFYTIIADQFTRLRDGDRFWYETRLDDELVDLIKETSLSDIIQRNSDIDYLQDDLFASKIRQGGDDGDNIINGTDGGDLLIGFDGNDILYGGAGDDVLYGGAGEDIFVFDKNSGGENIIRDFNTQEDALDISDIIEGMSCGCLYKFLNNFFVSVETEQGVQIDVYDPASRGQGERDFMILLEDVQNKDDITIIGLW